jgi:TRAP-type C4-dicarboxylate transport system substrate-binding protein
MTDLETRRRATAAHARAASLPLLSRRAFALALGGAGLLAAAPGAFAQGRAWRLASAWPEGNFQTLTTQIFADDFALAMGGKQAIEVYSNGSLYPLDQIAGAVGSGQVEMGELLYAWMGGQLPVAEADSIPFLAVGYAEARELWRASRNVFASAFARLNLIPIYAVPWPPIGLFSRYPVTHAVDLSGRRFLATSGVTERFATLVGALPVRLTPAQAVDGYNRGLFDAAFVPAVEGFGGTLVPPVYYYDVGAWVPKNGVVMNKALYEAQSTSTQEILIAAGERAEASGWAASQQEYANRLALLRGMGATVETPSPDLRASLRDVGTQLAIDWLGRAGRDGEDLLRQYRS